MALRVRRDGRLLCASMHSEESGDTYLHDGIHYTLSVEVGVVVTEKMEQVGGRGGHARHGEWWWSHRVPPDVVPDLWVHRCGVRCPGVKAFADWFGRRFGSPG